MRYATDFSMDREILPDVSPRNAIGQESIEYKASQAAFFISGKTIAHKTLGMIINNPLEL